MSTSLATTKPAFLQTGGPAQGLDDLKTIVTPPMLKIRQGLTKDERLRDEFREGDILLMPDYTLLYTRSVPETKQPSAPVSFTPLLFFKQWCVWNPLASYGKLPFIRESTRDPNHDIARKAQLIGDKKIKEPCPEFPGETLQFMEHFNYLAILHLEGLNSVPVLMTFASTGIKAGRKLSNLIVSRGADIYAGRYTFQSKSETNAKGSWYGLDLRNDDVAPWVTEQAQYEMFASMHADLKEKLNNNEVDINYDQAADSVYEESADDYSDAVDEANVSM